MFSRKIIFSTASFFVMSLLFFSVVVPLVSAQSDGENSAVSLRRNYEAGQKLAYSMNASVEGTGTDGGKTIKTALSMDIKYFLNVTAVDSSGVASVDLVYESIDIKMTAKSGRMKEDHSIKGDRVKLEKKVDGEIVEMKETPHPNFKMNKRGEIVDEDAQNNLLKKHPVLYFVVIFGMQALPGKPVKISDEWEARRLILDTGFLKSIPMNVKYKLEKFEKKNRHNCAAISIQGIQEEGGFKSGKFKQEISGMVWIDLASGCLVSSALEWKIEESRKGEGRGSLHGKKIEVNLLSSGEDKGRKSRRSRRER